MAKKASRSKKATSSKGKKSITVPVHSVVHFVKMLHDEGHAEEFVKAAKKSKAVMTMHADSVDFVRKYLSNNQLHHAMIARVVDPCPGDPFECHFRD
ncbi:MAG: hypothetical protein HY269_10390 [Deltaproteobacteria bacterium]|nr:hypothetical protein [Deltaproteobacteria bacterium]